MVVDRSAHYKDTSAFQGSEQGICDHSPEPDDRRTVHRQADDVMHRQAARRPFQPGVPEGGE
jgi:hypothetical protein